MDGVIHRAEQAILDKLITLTQVHSLSIEEVRGGKIKFMQANPAIAHDPTQVRKQFLAFFLKSKGLSADEADHHAEQLMQTFLSLRNQVTLFNQTEQVLTQLKSEFRLASLTNGNACLNTIGLSNYFEHSLSPETTGVKKPDVRIFQRLIKDTNLSPEQILHVGDHWEDDVVGAHSAGIHTLWVNPKQTPWPGPEYINPSGIVTGIHEVPHFIEAYQQS